MKNANYIIGLFILLLSNNKALSQESKRGNNWILGFAPVAILNFEPTSVFSVFSTGYFTRSNSTISDTLGNYQFYNSGHYMMDKLGDIMDNGAQVNCPYGTALSNHYGGDSPFTQTSIILPKKGNTYYVFSTGMSDSVADNYINHIVSEFDVLNYSIVDMDANAGKGKVTIKNKILIDKQHYANTALTAVRHGNGKDWWLVKADCNQNRYQLFQVKEDTILGPYYQYRTDTSNSFCYFFGQIYFSADGTKMASAVYGNKYADTNDANILPAKYRYTYPSGETYIPNRVDLYDFDRCTGIITYKNHYVIPLDTASYPNGDFKSGISFSPNGKLMYMSSNYTIYQIDLEDTTITNGIFISGPDTVISEFPWYNEMACGPDGKLYIGNWGGMRKYMSYIDQPNVKGLGCSFVANGVWQPYTNLLDPPNMPNYGLGVDSSGVNCWPLSHGELLMVNDELVVYPNPASNKLFISTRSKNKRELYNSIGQLIFTTFKDEIDVGNYAKGIYYLKAGNEVKKVVVE